MLGLGNHPLATIMVKTEAETKSRENSDEEQDVYMVFMCLPTDCSFSCMGEKKPNKQ